MTASDPWIEECEQETLHLPGAVQSWGALLVVDPTRMVVRHASANIGRFLDGLPDGAPEALIGADVPAVLAQVASDAARRCGEGTLAVARLVGCGGRPVLASGHVHEGALLLELEADEEAGKVAALDALWPRASSLIASICAAETSQGLFEQVVGRLRGVTGFERVMLYRFDAIGHGEVLAEDRLEALEPFLGLQFPASDVPRQARALYLRQRVRVIGDVQAAPVPLVGAACDGRPADLSLSAMRAVSHLHLQYMSNMGVRATIAISLVVDGVLWGMLVCHDRATMHVPPHIRSACQVIGQTTSLMIAALRDREAREAAAVRGHHLAAISRMLGGVGDRGVDLIDGLAGSERDLLALCGATGAIVRLNGRVASLGGAPSGATAEALVDALLRAEPEREGVLASDAFRSIDGLAGFAGCDAAGALLLSLEHNQGGAIVWLRPERASVVKWGGDPRVLATRDPTSGALSPRRSFTVWREEVRGRSLPWTDGDLAAICELRDEIDRFLAAGAETMRLARDAADRATQAKSEFLATMSHEIRSPLSGLLGVLELLRGSRLDAEQARMAGMIDNSANMLLAVLNDILDFSKIEAGAMSVEREPVGLANLLEDVVRPHAVSAAKKSVTVTLSVDPALPAAFLTDRLRTYQILTNLLSNAVKFTWSGEIAVSVGTREDGPTGPVVWFTVRDTGIGMTESVLARLFNPFMQADGSTTRQFGGTGLGLAISNKLARLLDGELTATSKVGRGSEFTLCLPLLACLAARESAQTRAEGSTGACGDVARHAGKRVLVVDDDATIRWLSQRQLEKLGFHVDTAEDGADGLCKLLGSSYELLLTDCHMPNIGGVELAKAVRSAGMPALQALPIIGLTADVTEAQRALCHQAGMSELAMKPLTLDALSKIMNRHLSQSGELASAEAAATLRCVDFEEQLYLSIFDKGDLEGAAWLEEFLIAIRSEEAALSLLFADGDDPALPRDEIVRIAHHMAGSAFSVGAMLLGEAAKALQHAAVQTAFEELCVFKIEVSAALSRAQAAIHAFVLPASVTIPE